MQPASPYNFSRNAATLLFDYLGNIVQFFYYDNFTLQEIVTWTKSLSARTGDPDLTKTDIPVFKERLCQRVLLLSA